MESDFTHLRTYHSHMLSFSPSILQLLSKDLSYCCPFCSSSNSCVWTVGTYVSREWQNYKPTESCRLRHPCCCFSWSWALERAQPTAQFAAYTRWRRAWRIASPRKCPAELAATLWRLWGAGSWAPNVSALWWTRRWVASMESFRSSPLACPTDAAFPCRGTRPATVCQMNESFSPFVTF